MPASALRPRSVTEIVDASFQILRAHFAALVLCSAIAYVPTLAVRFLLIGDPRRFESLDPSQLGEFMVMSMQSLVVALVSYALMSAVLTVCASQAYLGEPVDVGAAVRRVVRRLPAVLVAAALVSVLLILGLSFFLVPAMWVTARYFAVTPALLLEDKGVFAALSRSGELSRGRKWHVLNTLGLVLLIYFLVFFGVTLVASLFGNYVVSTLLAGVVTISLYPVVSIASLLLYYDARIQSEGLDIELMVGALGPAAAPAVR